MTEDIVLQNDDELFFPVKAGEKWFINFYLLGGATGSSGGIDFTFVVDGGAPDVSVFSVFFNDSISFGTESGFFPSVGSPATSAGRAVLDNTNGDDTTFRLRWAQNFTEGTNSMLKGSTLIAWKKP